MTVVPCAGHADVTGSRICVRLYASSTSTLTAGFPGSGAKITASFKSSASKGERVPNIARSAHGARIGRCFALSFASCISHVIVARLRGGKRDLGAIYNWLGRLLFVMAWGHARGGAPRRNLFLV